jgi:hypothetical protein
MPDAMRLFLLLVGAAVILSFQYLRRRTRLSRGVLVVATLLCFVTRFLPWNVAFAMQQKLTPGTVASRNIALRFDPQQGPYKQLSGLTHDILHGQYGGTNGDTVVYIPLRVVGLPADGLLKNDRADVHLIASDGSVVDLGVGGDFEPFPRGNLSGNVYYPVYVPDDLFKRLKDQHVRLEIDYSLTLMQQNATGAMSAINGSASFQSLGHCTSRLNSSETSVEVRCLEPGSIPLCTTAVLENPATGSQNPPRFSCSPNYAKFYPVVLPDGMSRFSAGLPFRDANGLAAYPVQGKDLSDSQIRLSTYETADHLRRRLDIADIQLGQWLPH